MRAWRLDGPSVSGQIDLSRATGLVSSIGSGDTDALAGEILKILSDPVAISQCTVFAYEFGNRPRTLCVADRRGGRYLHDVADEYVRRFYLLDDNQKIITAVPSGAPASNLLLHRQTSQEIAHDGYREACYLQPDVSDRVCVLLQPSPNVWLSINLYRDRRRGDFLEREICLIEAFAPLISHAAKHHYSLCGQLQTSIPKVMLARVRAACPELSKRELDVICGILDGRTSHEIGDMIGVKASSVVTYQKRAYRRLGISSQRQLFVLCLTAGRN
jgi:DNA-binding CsgD family transcriptional regulator